MPKQSGPFFIIGTERSGSNLLRLVLNSHSRLFVPHPPHIMHLMGGLRYGNRFEEMVRDVCRLIEAHFYPWDLHLDWREVMRVCRGRTLFSVYAAVHEMYLAQVGKARWGCKSTFMIHCTSAVLEHYPAAQFILLVRDPRDVAVSARKSVFNHYHPYYVARRWRDEQRIGARLLDTLPPERIHLMRYEDLIAEPERQLRALCEFLGEAFEPAMLRFFDTDEARRSASLARDWRNTGQTFMTGNRGKFVRELRAADVALVEGLCASLMQRLDYPLIGEGRVPGDLEPIWFWFVDQMWRLRVEVESASGDRAFWRRRMRKLALMWWLRLKSLYRLS